MSQQNLTQEAEAKQETPPPPLAVQEPVATTNQLLQQSNPIATPEQIQQAEFAKTQPQIDRQQRFRIDHQHQSKIDGLTHKVHELESSNAQLQNDIEKWRRASQARDTEFTQIRQEKANLEKELS